MYPYFIQAWFADHIIEIKITVNLNCNWTTDPPEQQSGHSVKVAFCKSLTVMYQLAFYFVRNFMAIFYFYGLNLI